MIITTGTLIWLLIFITNPQQGLTLTVGRLVYSSGLSQQNISVKNDTQNTIHLVKVECGFFNKGELIATDIGYVENIAPNATGFTTILA